MHRCLGLCFTSTGLTMLNYNPKCPFTIWAITELKNSILAAVFHAKSMVWFTLQIVEFVSPANFGAVPRKTATPLSPSLLEKILQLKHHGPLDVTENNSDTKKAPTGYSLTAQHRQRCCTEKKHEVHFITPLLSSTFPSHLGLPEYKKIVLLV